MIFFILEILEISLNFFEVFARHPVLARVKMHVALSYNLPTYLPILSFVQQQQHATGQRERVRERNYRRGKLARRMRANCKSAYYTSAAPTRILRRGLGGPFCACKRLRMQE